VGRGQPPARRAGARRRGHQPFDGYENLAEFDWDAYRAQYATIGRLDLILAAEGDSPNNYRLSKQADVLMLFYLLSAEEPRDTLGRLGYPLTPGTIRATVDFYTGRTSHGSTLSRVVHAWVNARADRHRAWSLFCEALQADLTDTQGGTTREGVHLGAMAGTVDLILRCFAGLETRDDVLWLHPVLPPELTRAEFTILYHGQRGRCTRHGSGRPAGRCRWPCRARRPRHGLVGSGVLQVPAGESDSPDHGGDQAEAGEDDGGVPPHVDGGCAGDVVQQRGVQQPAAGAQPGTDDLDEERPGD
jgi:hypothetical protein